MWNYYALLFPEQHFKRVYTKTRALQRHHARAHLTVWCALWERGKKHLELSRAPTAKDLHQIALALFNESALIKAVLHGRRGVRVGKGGVFLEALTCLMVHRISTWWGHFYHRYVSRQPNSNLALYYKCLHCTLAMPLFSCTLLFLIFSMYLH